MSRRIDWFGLTAATLTTLGAASVFLAGVAGLMYPVVQALHLGP